MRVEGLEVNVSADTAQFNENMKELRNSAKRLSVDLKAVNRDLKMNPSSIKVINQKISTLKDNMQVAKRKQAELNAELKRMESAGKIDTDQYIKLKKELITTSNQVDRFAKDIDKLNRRKIALNVSNDSMRKVRQDFKQIDMSAEDAQEKVNLLKMRINELGAVSSARLNKVAQGFNNVGNKISGVGRTTLPVSAGILGIAGASIKMAGDTQDNVAKTDAVFKKNADEVQAWANKNANSFLLSKNKAMEISSTYGNMATSMGLSTEQASKMSLRLTALVGDMKSFNGTTYTTEELQESLNGIFTGEGEALEKLGVSMKVADLERYAHTQGIKKEYDEMSQSEQIMLRYNYVLAQTKNQQGDAKRNAESFSTTWERLKGKIQDTVAVIGENLLPMATKVMLAIEKVVDRVKEMSPAQQQMLLGISALTMAIPPLLIAIGKISIGIGAVTKAVALVKAPLMAFRMTLMSNIASAGLFKGVLASLKAVFATITSPVGLVVTAIAGLVTAFVLAYNKCKWFRQIVDNLVKFFVASFKPILNDISTFIRTTVTPAFKSIGDWCQKHVSPILKQLGNLMKTHLKTAFTILSSKIKMVIAVFRSLWDIVKFVGQLLTGDFSGATKTAKNMLSYLRSAVQNVWNEMKKTWVGKALINIFNAIKSVANRLYSVLKNTGAIKVLMNAFNGLKTVLRSVGSVMNNLKNIATSVFNFVSSKVGAIGKKLSQLNPFDAGGFGNVKAQYSLATNGFSAGGIGNNSVVLNANFTLNTSEQTIDANTFRNYGSEFIDYIDVELGKRMGW